MKISEAECFLVEGLKGIYDEAEGRNIAQLVLEDCTGHSPTYLRLNRGEDLRPEEEAKLGRYLKRLQQHEPVQYITNKTWFYQMELYVDKHVLIPRPETEELVEWIIHDVKKAGTTVFERNPTQADATTELKILDVGTGSGCIALALKKFMPKAEVWGCDNSEEALNVARRNGATLDVRVDFQGINFLDEVQHRLLPSIDIIVSNPPYIPEKDKQSMQPNVLRYEPHTALFVPDEDVLLFYRAIACFAEKQLHPNGSIYLEIHEELAAAVAVLFRNHGYEVEVRKDMQGKNRMVKAFRKGK